MRASPRSLAVLLAGATLVPNLTSAQDWPQWRGPHRDGKPAAFKAPASWPTALQKAWSIRIGDGVAAPSLVGDRIYAFAREEGGEKLRCLDAGTGKEIWSDRYDALGADGPAGGFAGPRCSPAVAGGKVVTVGVRGMVSCLDATTGKVLWRRNDYPGAVPRFYTSSSPMIAGGLAITQVGGPGNGGIVAYDLASGEPRWKWTGDGPAYASPTLARIGDAGFVVAQTESKMVALALADGRLVWETAFAVQGRGYNAVSPVVDGDVLIYSGSNRGTTAVRLARSGESLTATPLWANADVSCQFSTPVLQGGRLHGLNAANEWFSLDAQTGTVAWTAPAPAGEGAAPGPRGPRPERGGAPGDRSAPGGEGTQASPDATRPGGGPGGAGRGPGGPGGPGGRGGRGGGYGSLVAAGDVVMALTPASQLVVFTAGGSEYRELARIQVAETPTHAHPVLSGDRLLVKDRENLILWRLP